MSVDDQTLAKLYDLATELAARLQPRHRAQYERITARARRAAALAFQRDHLDEFERVGFVVERSP
jgi:hypothetical protein